MPQATYHDLIVATGGRPSGGVRLADRAGRVRTDSRQIATGDIFWALPGSSSDGHDFVGEAVRRGASCCVVQVDRPAFAGIPHVVVPDALRALSDFARGVRNSAEAMVIGITGSVGKTTTRTMLHAVLSARFTGLQSPANFNNHVGVPLSLLDLREGDEFAVIEMGASAVGEIAQLAEIARPEAAIITSVAPAHLADFGSIEAIAQAKGELAEAIPADGFVVLNGDNPRVRAIAGRTACRAILVGEGRHNDLSPAAIVSTNDVLTITVGNMAFRLNAIGRHHVCSALACIAVAREIGLTDAEIARGFENFAAVPGRCRRVDVGPWTVIDDTYNASPSSMAAACEVLRNWQGAPRKWLVLGDMLALGPDSVGFHKELGALAGQTGCDGIVAIGEFAGEVVTATKAQRMFAGQLAVCRDLSTLVLHLDCWLSRGDVVLVKGSRGMKMERVIEELKQLAVSEERVPQRMAA
jgi:UDP-N-acetylmuramoyl-tripeptide--D-alanyl-D-alanine ligase